MSELFKPILVNNSIKFIIAHNHPSGDSTPSNNDIEITKKIIESANMLGIEFLDHIVITNNSYQSIIQML